MPPPPPRGPFEEEAWGQFLLRNPPPPLHRGQRSGFPARHSEAESLPLLSPSALACCFSTWSAQAEAPTNATATRAFPALESPSSVSPPRKAHPFLYYTTAEASRESLLPPPSSHSQDAAVGRHPTQEAGGAEAVRWVTRRTCGGPTGARGKTGSAHVMCEE